jgi:uncharacterized protein (TIGR02147 family)
VTKARSVYDYEDYRRFLADSYAGRKRLNRGFSYGVFARRAGVARSYLQMVMDGKRSLAAEGARPLPTVRN